MNCPKCGSALAPGTLFCPVCNEPIAQSYSTPQGYPQQSYGYPVQGVEQPSVTGYAPANPSYGAYAPQGYPAPTAPGYQPYGQNTYPTGFQQPYAYGEQRGRGNPFFSALSELPHAFLGSFRAPEQVLRGLMERNDLITAPLTLGVVVLLSFLGGMTIMRGFVGNLFQLISVFTGVSMAGSATSMNQGINYVAGRIAPSVGGIAALCQLIAMITPGLVLCVYLTAVCKLRLTMPVALGLITVPSFPTVIFALVSMALSLVTPWLSIVCILAGTVVSYTQLSALMNFVTGRADAQLFVPKMVCFSLSMAATLLLILLVGGSLLGAVSNQMLQLLANVGSLI